MTEKKSGLVKPCQFPFNFKGQTFESCTTIIRTDPIVHGDAWCSTNTDSNNNHVEGGGFYGDCGPKCPFRPSAIVPKTALKIGKRFFPVSS